MSSTSVAIVTALIGVLGAILGAVAGFGLSEWATQQREAHAEVQRNRNVRILLHREIEENLRELKDYLFRATHQPNGAVLVGFPTELDFQKRRQFLTTPSPRLSHDCWLSQLSHVPAALTSEQIRQVFTFHAKLDRLDTMRTMLAADPPDEDLCAGYDIWRAKPQETRKTFDEATYITGKPGPRMQTGWLRPDFSEGLLALRITAYNERNSQLWHEYEGLINALLQGDNPLPEPTEGEGSISLRLRITNRAIKHSAK